MRRKSPDNHRKPAERICSRLRQFAPSCAHSRQKKSPEFVACPSHDTGAAPSEIIAETHELRPAVCSLRPMKSTEVHRCPPKSTKPPSPLPRTLSSTSSKTLLAAPTCRAGARRRRKRRERSNPVKPTQTYANPRKPPPPHARYLCR